MLQPDTTQSVMASESFLKGLLSAASSPQWNNYIAPYLSEQLALEHMHLESCSADSLARHQAAVKVYKDLLRLAASVETRLSADKVYAEQ